jgi:thiamine-phosphate pyrophosphorylase
MSLNDAIKTQQLKNMRHGILATNTELQEQLLRARDSEGDVGSTIKAPGQDNQQDITGIIIANARRVQESLRVLEEIAKTQDTGLNSDEFREARFGLYTIEKELLSMLQRLDRLKRLTGLYVIIDTPSLRGRDHIETAATVIRAGAGIIQLRDKEHNKRDIIEIARKIGELCHKTGTLFIVNDYLDVALASDADGLHVGEQDLPPGIARKFLPCDKILGCSVRTVDAAMRAVTDGADHLGVGGMYSTVSKAENEVIGPEGLRAIRNAVYVPLVAIGGINRENVKEVLGAGADAVAVINAVLGSEDAGEATRQMLNAIEGGGRG